MASVSVYKSSANYVLGTGTKTLTLPTQDTGWLSVPPTELRNYNDNYSQQRPGWGRVRTRYLPVKASSKHCSLQWRGCAKIAPSLSHLFCPQAWSTHPVLRHWVPGLFICTNQDSKPHTFLGTTLAWSQAAPDARWKPSGYVLTKADRYTCRDNLSLDKNKNNNFSIIRTQLWNDKHCNITWRFNKAEA